MATAYIIANNPKYNSREIKFESKPNAETREALKALKMRWNPSKAVWYGFASEDAIVDALSLTNVDQPENLPKPSQPLKPYKPSKAAAAKATKASKPAEIVNADGVKVGDLFYDSWGWEETVCDFFQCVEIKSAHTVILKRIGSETVSEWGNGYQQNRRAVPDSFIKDQPEEGYTVRTRTDAKFGLSLRSPLHKDLRLPLWRTTADEEHYYSLGWY